MEYVRASGTCLVEMDIGCGYRSHVDELPLGTCLDSYSE